MDEEIYCTASESYDADAMAEWLQWLAAGAVIHRCTKRAGGYGQVTTHTRQALRILSVATIADRPRYARAVVVLSVRNDYSEVIYDEKLYRSLEDADECHELS